MTTTIQSLPLLTTTVEIAGNESWRDTFVFGIAAVAVAAPVSGNAGNGAIGNLAVSVGAPLGSVTVKILAVGAESATFGVLDGNGDVIAFGAVGEPFGAGGLAFELVQGSTPFAAGDGFTVTTLPGPTDLTGITFELMVRDQATDINIVLIGRTSDGTLINGGPQGGLSTAFDVSLIRNISPGTYLFDVQAVADGVTRRVVTGTLTIDPPVTY